MSPRVQHVFACQGCGAVSPKWLGRCPECSEWNTYVEELTGEARGVASETRAAPIVEASSEPEEPHLDDAPGIRPRARAEDSFRAPWCFSAASPASGSRRSCSRPGRGVARSGEVLYATGEESAGQVRLRGERLGIREERLLVAAETDVSRIVALAERRAPALLVVDSIQAVRDAALTSAAGTVSQVRESALVLQRFAKRVGSARGPHRARDQGRKPRRPEVARASGRRRRLDRGRAGRDAPDPARDEEPVRAGRRAGALRDDGRGALRDRERVGGAALGAARRASPAAPSRRRARGPGRCSSRCRRSSARPRPARRAAWPSVLDGARLALLLAVLEGAGLALSTREVFVSCTGGLEVGEPAADLAVVAALISSARGKGPPRRRGLLRRDRAARRSPTGAGGRWPGLKEASALGFSTVYLPAGNASEAAPFPDLTVAPVDRVSEFLRRWLSGRRAENSTVERSRGG